ncbi:efflux RND transporter periplasmic adaptor subunit [Mesorhizobium sp. RP14(2022)]|uniref:Efflux RND transporter periplasmic adaptor subunit n=1 Tax=Mesorhizobium liriopis TaxID=2953882 RepID=A0ABT1C2I4_9HYPH|nr:efflux RND transporter periplasmic adaptor subunit [Mesorhizobium liriopis]MCO6048982.1 efflux RND transporter periplasmic adaptor subunit [Mesorhizobium liriopis]
MTFPFRTLPLAASLLLGLSLGNAEAEEARAATEAKSPDAPVSLSVTTDRVREQAVSVPISGTGLVEAWQEVVVGAESGGVALREVLVSEGDHVEKGQVLARLDAALLKAQIAQQDAAVRSAEASARNAVAASERALRLSRSGTLASETVETRQTTLETANAAVEQAKAVRDTLAVQLDRLEIRAPFAGVISAKPAVEGGMVQAGTEIARIQRDGALEARIKIPEQRLGLVSVGDAVTLDGSNGKPVTAKVTSLGQTVDATSHLATVAVRLPEGSGFRAGMFVRGTVNAAGGRALTVAQGALTWVDNKPAVFVVNDDSTVSRRTVQAGARAEGRITVSGDLKPDEMVVAEGAGFLADGNRVLVVESQAQNDETVTGDTTR